VVDARQGRAGPGGLLLGLGAAVLLAAALGGFPGDARADAPHTGVSRISLGSGIAQTQSRRCGSCHNPEFALWALHPHSRFLVDPARDPRLVAAQWGEGAAGWKEHVAGRFGPKDVALAFGVIETQIYFRRDPDGHRPLPAQWDHRNNRWDAPGPLLASAVAAGTTWEAGCAGCHTTGFSPADGSFTEAGAGCAACHGSGEAHLATGGQGPILRPSELEPGRRSELCGACHARGRDRVTGLPYAVGFQPGKSLGDVLELAAPEPGRTTEFFWSDGTERLPFMEYQGFVQSGHYRVGLACTTCHLPHGSDQVRGLRRRTADLCLGCHGDVLGAVRAHTAHPEGKADCVGCHMSPVDPSARAARVRTHTFRFLAPDRSGAAARPSSCTGACHPGKDSAWAAEALRGWR